MGWWWKGSSQSGHAHAQWSRLALYFQWRYITVGSEWVVAKTTTLLPDCLFRLKEKKEKNNKLLVYLFHLLPNVLCLKAWAS